MGKLDQLLDAYEEAVIDLAVERVRGEDSMTLLRYERYLDAARDDIEQYVEALEEGGEHG